MLAHDTLVGAAIVSSAPSQATVQGLPACNDGVDNDGDGLVDWLDDPACADDPSALSEGVRAVCNDGMDNDRDGVIDRDDPGCKGHASGTDETDPPAVRSTFRFTAARPYGCGIESGVEVLPDLSPKSLFPLEHVLVRLRGLSGRARGIDITRRLPLSASNGYAFDRLRPGRFQLTGSYPGDRFRLATAAVQRRVTLPASRCRVYVTGSDQRRYKPSILYFGASQRIFDITWQRWGRSTATGVGTYPVNDCIPRCAAGSITDYPVTVRLSRRRVCNGYVQYLTMRRTYRGPGAPGSPRTETVQFGYRCR